MQSVVYRNVDFTRDLGYADIPELDVPFNHPQTATIIALPLDPARNYTVSVSPKQPDKFPGDYLLFLVHWQVLKFF